MEEINEIELMYIVCCLTVSEVIVRSEQHAIVDMMNVMFWCILVHAPMTTVFMSFLLEVSGGTVTSATKFYPAELIQVRILKTPFRNTRYS